MAGSSTSSFSFFLRRSSIAFVKAVVGSESLRLRILYRTKSLSSSDVAAASCKSEGLNNALSILWRLASAFCRHGVQSPIRGQRFCSASEIALRHWQSPKLLKPITWPSLWIAYQKKKSALQRLKIWRPTENMTMHKWLEVIAGPMTLFWQPCLADAQLWIYWDYHCLTYGNGEVKGYKHPYLAQRKEVDGFDQLQYQKAAWPSWFQLAACVKHPRHTMRAKSHGWNARSCKGQE